MFTIRGGFQWPGRPVQCLLNPLTVLGTFMEQGPSQTLCYVLIGIQDCRGLGSDSFLWLYYLGRYSAASRRIQLSISSKLKSWHICPSLRRDWLQTAPHVPKSGFRNHSVPLKSGGRAQGSSRSSEADRGIIWLTRRPPDAIDSGAAQMVAIFTWEAGKPWADLEIPSILIPAGFTCSFDARTTFPRCTYPF